ncbi:DUF1093 domain-containing protein [Periweissella cryptocerci]|uniref:DUF1093 domain-containing protein n=1 Tax=Periweissella cryptocerci TaxID=2506420 RepID=A0A4P6YV57_9LACO|nr:DUF1093 domain-containing protein [Periweissella cryptocerci]QBO36587.1 DUF1093 domain-containing protein [Periweissella cryptocerci]
MKKMITIIIALVVIIGIFIGINKAASYKHDRYDGQPVYFTAPAAPKQTVMRDDNGKVILDSKGKKSPIYSYKHVKTYTKTGQTKYIEFDWEGSTPMQQDAPYTASASKTIVVKGPNTIAADKIPANIKKILNLK